MYTEPKAVVRVTAVEASAVVATFYADTEDQAASITRRLILFERLREALEELASEIEITDGIPAALTEQKDKALDVLFQCRDEV